MTATSSRLDSFHRRSTHHLPARLQPAELRAIARSYAGNPNLDALLTDTGERTWARLAGDTRSDVWLISWPEGTETGWHDHGESNGAFAVAAGTVIEETWALRSVQRRVLAAGDHRAFNERHVHNVRGAGPGRALTVHAYSPALIVMGDYEIGPDGPIATSTRQDETSW